MGLSTTKRNTYKHASHANITKAQRILLKKAELL
jgi:hypothetical protein